MTEPAPGPGTRLAINRLKDQTPLDSGAVDEFLTHHDVPIVEGARCTFLFRGEADEVHLAQRIVGLADLPKGAVERDGFETSAEVPDEPYVAVEALDADGEVLATAEPEAASDGS